MKLPELVSIRIVQASGGDILSHKSAAAGGRMMRTQNGRQVALSWPALGAPPITLAGGLLTRFQAMVQDHFGMTAS